MKKDISIYLNDIIENMERIETFTTGMGYDDFVSDEKTHFAVILNYFALSLDSIELCCNRSFLYFLEYLAIILSRS